MSQRIILPVIVLALLSSGHGAQAATGRTVGSFAVSRTGAATYSIPIWAPRGPHGLQPNVSLTYNSQSGGGAVGLGWSIAGLSGITRCDSTYAQDGAPAPVTLSYSDRFCLDGQRLRLTSSEDLTTYGRDATTYQTEIADFSNVEAHGVTGQGPSSFTVQTKNGLTYEYGNGRASQVLLNGTVNIWMLDKVTDRAGNTMTYSYVAANTNVAGIALPDTISWTPSAAGSTAYNYAMKFTYDPTTSIQSAGYVSGNQTLLSADLLGITVSYVGTVVKNYVFSYTPSLATERLKLASVTECADAGATNCLAPTSMSYQPGVAGIASPLTNTGSGATLSVDQAVDLDGDGKTDLIFTTANANGTLQWWAQLATATGFSAPINTGVSSTVFGVRNVLFESFDGTPGNQILAPNGNTWYIYRYNPATNAFTQTPTTSSVVPGALYASADVDGDGLPDLTYVNGVFDSKVQVQHNQSTPGAVSFGAVTSYGVPVAPCNSCNPSLTGNNQVLASSVKKMDFDGDGRQDLILSQIATDTSDTASVTTLLSRGPNGFVVGETKAIVGLGSVVPVNWNDDACTDLVVGAQVFVSQCNGQSALVVALPGTPFLGVDWNGDGRTDLILQNSGGYQLYLSTGTDVISNTLFGFSAGSGTIVVLDQNGDGLDDVACSCGTNGAIRYGLHNGSGQPADLLSNVTDGYGNSANPTYVSIVAGSYSQANPTYPDPPTYPERYYMGPLNVVNQATFSDPSSAASNATYQKLFWYYDAWTNPQGRGFSGFKQVAQQDLRNGLWDTVGYGGTFPYSSFLAFDTISRDQAGNQVVHFSSYNYPTVFLDATPNNQRWFVNFDTATDQAYEVGGSKNGQLISTAITHYAYDNYGNGTSITRVVTDKDSGSPYYNDTWTTTTTNTPAVDTGNWCLNLFTGTQVAYTASDGSTTVTRTKSFTPDTANCRVSDVVTEPNSATLKVMEHFGYDSFGNVASDTVTGVGMTARLTTINWGATGQFPAVITDASGATTQLDYNFSYGVPSKLTDANVQITSWDYTDGFGRRTKEMRPDQTYTVWNYLDCANAGGCYFGSHSLAIEESIYNSDNTILNQPLTYYDQQDRFLMSTKSTLAGFDQNEVRYDALGHIVKRAMPCNWTAALVPCPYWTAYAYDVLGRVTQTQRPISASNSSPQYTTYQYAGRTTTITDANGHAKTLVIDVKGGLRRTQDATGYAITLGYDAAGSRNSTRDSLGNTLWSATYQYGVAPFMVSSNDADLGAWSYTIDALGEKTGWQDAKGQSFTAAYDALSRMTDRYEPDLYSHWTWGTNASVYEMGQLHSVCTGTGINPTNCTASPGYSESETYDSRGRRSQRSIQIPGDGTYSYTWAYNATTGLLDTLTYPTSTSGYQLEVQYGYGSGFLKSVTDISDSPNVSLWTANAADAAGHFTQETLGNNVIVNHSFDAVTGWLSSITAGLNGGAGLQNNSYLFDGVGNLTQRQDNNAGLTENIYLDALNRLDHTVGGTNTQLTYDSMGRLSTWAAYSNAENVDDYTTAQSGCAYYANVQPHAVRKNTQGSGSTSFCYDRNGNMTTDGAGGSILAQTWMSYNQPNLITGGTSSSQFFYDQNHQRWKQVASYSGSAEITEYIGGLLEKMTNSSGIAFRYYVPAGNNTVVYNRWSSGSNSIAYITKDNLGSSAVITDHAGALVVKEKFSALGWNENTAAEEATMATVTRHEFTGHEGLDNAGLWLVNMNGRIYSPFGSYFFSPDPKIPDPTNTLSYNRYAYTNYNPLTYVDPSGFDECAAGCETVTVLPPEGGGGFENAGTGGNNSSGRGDWSNLQNWGIAAWQNPRRIDPYLARAFGRALSDPVSQGDQPTSDVTVTATRDGGSDDSVPEVVLVADRSARVTWANIVVVLDWNGYMHVATQHMWFPWPYTSRYSEKFWSITAITKLLDATLHQTEGVPLTDPTLYAFTSNLGYDVGTDQLGALTSLNTVIVQLTGPNTGIVRTMHPGGLSD